MVEQATSAAIFALPRHPYTRALLAAVPHPDPASRGPGDPAELPSTSVDSAGPGPGCAYAPRCVCAVETCRIEPPRLEETGAGHLTACPRWRVLPPQDGPG
jgi:oligopeptide/dipeptide ABC transporter ATP-binding protein